MERGRKEVKKQGCKEERAKDCQAEKGDGDGIETSQDRVA
jgi:hypothetical protein